MTEQERKASKWGRLVNQEVMKKDSQGRAKREPKPAAS
jgi:hypothetical protein